MKHICLVSLTLIVLHVTSFAHNWTGPGPTRIIIIRHGEKPDKGDNLSCTGLNRALQLPGVLNRKIGKPDFIYTPALNMGKSTSTARMYQTIVPFAVTYDLKINTRYDVSDTKDIAKELLQREGTILVVWEHKAAEKLAKHLGIDDPDLKWDDNDFDSMWIITFQNGKAKLSKDHENIHPSDNCP
jgi:hypothetical protein